MTISFRRWDHRELSKALIRLAQEEPGDNWVNATYRYIHIYYYKLFTFERFIYNYMILFIFMIRWAKYDSPVPGWLLPMQWTLPDDDDDDNGPRRHGKIFSCSGLNKHIFNIYRMAVSYILVHRDWLHANDGGQESASATFIDGVESCSITCMCRYCSA